MNIKLEKTNKFQLLLFLSKILQNEIFKQMTIYKESQGICHNDFNFWIENS